MSQLGIDFPNRWIAEYHHQGHSYAGQRTSSRDRGHYRVESGTHQTRFMGSTGAIAAQASSGKLSADSEIFAHMRWAGPDRIDRFAKFGLADRQPHTPTDERMFVR